MDMWQPDILHPPKEYKAGNMPWEILDWEGPEWYSTNGIEWKLIDQNGPVIDGL